MTRGLRHGLQSMIHRAQQKKQTRGSSADKKRTAFNPAQKTRDIHALQLVSSSWNTSRALMDIHYQWF